LPLCFLPSFSSVALAQIQEDRLNPLIVTATRQETRVSEALADVTVIDRTELEKSGQDTLADVLVRQPGIQYSSNGGFGAAASFYLRGANANQTKVLVDGIALSSSNVGGAPLFHLIPLADIERVEILRGPAATLYGADAVGGVIHIITRRGEGGRVKPDAFIGYGSRNTRQASMGVSGGDERWRFRIEGNYQKSAGFSALRHSTGQDADDDGYRNSGGAASLSFLPSRDHEIGFSYRGNSGWVKTDCGYSPSFTCPFDAGAKFKTQQWQVFAKNRFLNETWKSTLRYGEDRENYIDHGYDDWSGSETVSPFWSRSRQLSWQNDVRLPLGDLLLAAEEQRQSLRKDDKGVFDHGHSLRNSAFLLGWTARLHNHSWQVNARSDDHSRYGQENTWGVSYGYQFTPEWRARASYGTAFKAPSLYQLYSGYYGDPALKPEKAKSREAALIWARDTHTASLTVYRNNVRDMIAWDNAKPGTLWGGYNNVDRAKLSGTTLSYTGQFGEWSLGASYDYLDAKTRDADGNWVFLGRRARHSGKITLDKSWGDRFQTGAEIVATGRRRDATYAKSAASKEELGGYALANLTASYLITPEWRVEGRLNNLFDKKYETARHYNSDGGFNAFIGLRYTPR
jgi:vitamin B12 transporter